MLYHDGKVALWGRASAVAANTSREQPYGGPRIRWEDAAARVNETHHNTLNVA